MLLCPPCWAFPQGYPLLNGICPADSSFHCPSSHWTFAPVQTVAPLTWLGGVPFSIWATSYTSHEEPPHSQLKEEMPLHKALSRSCQEAFSRDSRLVQKAREDYFWGNWLHFNSENSCNLMDVFHNMIDSTGLLGSEIYEIQETWMG